jgi:hypothetical protein
MTALSATIAGVDRRICLLAGHTNRTIPAGANYTLVDEIPGCRDCLGVAGCGDVIDI